MGFAPEGKFYIIDGRERAWRILVLDPVSGERTLHRELEATLGDVDALLALPDGTFSYSMPDRNNDLFVVEGLR